MSGFHRPDTGEFHRGPRPQVVARPARGNNQHVTDARDDFVRRLTLEQVDRDIFTGRCHAGAPQRAFGGQVAAQSLVAAGLTVEDPDRVVHSLHGYFLRPGDPDLPTVFLVDRIRDGRSFATRRVTGVQRGEAIFSMSASFHIAGDEGIEHQDRMPPVIAPDDIADRRDTVSGSDRALFAEWENFDIRIVPRDQMELSDYLVAQQRVWFRYRHRLPDDPVSHICVLAYMSDMTLLGSAKAAHPDANPQSASLDHAMWFHRPFRMDDWLLYVEDSPSAHGARGFCRGSIFARDGRLIASVTQEGLMRQRTTTFALK